MAHRNRRVQIFNARHVKVQERILRDIRPQHRCGKPRARRPHSRYLCSSPVTKMGSAAAGFVGPLLLEGPQALLHEPVESAAAS